MNNYDFNLAERITELGYDMEEVSPDQEQQLRMALADLANAAYTEVKRIVQENLKSTRVDYLKNLQFQSLGNQEWTISLAEEAAHLDEGYGPFDMKPGLLSGPNAKISEDGVPYNIIPIKGSGDYTEGGGGKTEFRVVTGNSPANSWIHPGFAGLQAFDAVAGYIDEQIDRMIYSVLG